MNSRLSDTNANVNPSTPAIEELARVFNSALVSTRTQASRDLSAELYSLVESPAFHAILTAIRHLSRHQSMSDKEAAEAVISTFRRMDTIWSEYLNQEGLDRLKAQLKI